MAQVTFTPLVPKSPENVNTLNNILLAFQAGINSIDETQLTTGVLQKLGLNNGSQVGRGKSVIAGQGTRTNTAYGQLDGGAAPGPDQVANVVLPADGLFVVAFQATWSEAVSGAARAAIFIGSNQLKIATQNTAAVQEASIGGTAGLGIPLSSSSTGLISATTGTGYAGDATTGQLVGLNVAGGGGPSYVFASAGTYTVSVQFKATSGAITVQSRKLWVWTIAF